MSWPKDAYYYLSGRHIPVCTIFNKTILLGVGRKEWSGGILSLTYLCDIPSKDLVELEGKVKAWITGEGTGEMELLLVQGKDVSETLREHMSGSVGILPVTVKDTDTVALLIDANPLVERKRDFVAVYWLHFHFE